MIGKVVANFRIEKLIGSGGMADVYLALDLDLKRKAALKFLRATSSNDEKARQQLLDEARRSSRLDHPNICTIFQIGEDEAGALFIAMAYYDGQTLEKRLREGPLPPEEAARIAAQVAEGLAEAHRHGIVHSDVKPANILLTREGRVKVLDFGIARLVHGIEQKRRPKSVLGTLPYMSPEQLRGQPVDHRTDIWSLGVVLYQMLTGERPFQGDKDSLRGAILKGRRPPLGDYLSGESLRMQRILSWCLAAKREHRYSAPSLARELRLPAGSMPRGPGVFEDPLGTGSGTEPTTGPTREEPTWGDLAVLPSVAVLPFADLSAEADREFLASGVAEEVSTRLARVDGLRVVGRASTASPSLASLSPRQIGERLGVGYVLAGSVRTAGKAVRVTVQLTSVADDSVKWSESYHRDLEDLFEIQDHIAEHIAMALELELMGRKPAASSGARHEAHALYLKGRYCWNLRTSRSLVDAVGYFKQAIVEAPDYAQAHAGLADAWALLGIYGARPPSEVMPPAKTAAQEALSLDPELAEAYTSRGCIRSAYEWDWAGAAADFRRAIHLRPIYATAYQWYAMNCQIPKRRFGRAAELLERAARLEPISMAIRTSLGLLEYYSGKPEQAVETYLRVMGESGSFPQAKIFLAHALREAGRPREALEVAFEVAEETGGRPTATAVLAISHAACGHRDRAYWLLEKLLEPGPDRYVPRTLLSQVYTALEERNLAISTLEKACRFRSSDLIWLGVEPLFGPLRSIGRFHQILQEMGLERRP
ncbi:MAG: protein kinase [Holophagales bacterium]|nr:protein kinase [Holophagales bacterium]